MVEKLTRRQLLKLMGLTAGSALLACSNLSTDDHTLAKASVEATLPEATHTVYIPTVTTAQVTTPPPEARVVHVHNPSATNWNYSSPDYWNYVNQAVIDSMVDEGVKRLTGKTTLAAAWRAILPNYQPGQGIAIKVNFNNSNESCSDVENKIDAIAEPVNAIIRGLKSMGVLEPDIWIYDAIRFIPDRFTQKILYAGVRLFDKGCNEPVSFSSNDPNAVVQFSVPVGETVRIADLLINATYLINVPIMKLHSMAGVSLGFKHHFGTINKPASLHDFIKVFNPTSQTNLQCIVDIYLNPHIRQKTILTVGDGIFGCNKTDGSPVRWPLTFNNQVPKSLFFSQDPLADDCVMLDLLEAEWSSLVPSRTQDYLALAGNAGLGVFERGDPWGDGYDQIDYQKVEQ